MRVSNIYKRTAKFIKKDILSEFLNKFEFSPNAFGHPVNNPKAICTNRIIGDFEIILVISGESRISIEDKLYICSRGDLIFIPPFTKHKIETSLLNPHNNFWIHFDVFPVHSQTEFIFAMQSTHKYITKIAELDKLLMMCQNAEDEFSKNSQGYFTLIQSLILQIIIDVLKNKSPEELLTNDNIPSNNQGTKIINRCIEYINLHISDPIYPNDLYKELNVSESFLYKTFMKVLGTSPINFITRYKIRKAEQLMLSTAMTFKQISQELGFSSPYYFSSVFKKYYGMSPKEYLKNLY